MLVKKMWSNALGNITLLSILLFVNETVEPYRLWHAHSRSLFNSRENLNRKHKIIQKRHSVDSSGFYLKNRSHSEARKTKRGYIDWKQQQKILHQPDVRVLFSNLLSQSTRSNARDEFQPKIQDSYYKYKPLTSQQRTQVLVPVLNPQNSKYKPLPVQQRIQDHNNIKDRQTNPTNIKKIWWNNYISKYRANNNSKQTEFFGNRPNVIQLDTVENIANYPYNVGKILASPSGINKEAYNAFGQKITAQKTPTATVQKSDVSSYFPINSKPREVKVNDNNVMKNNAFPGVKVIDVGSDDVTVQLSRTLSLPKGVKSPPNIGEPKMIPQLQTPNNYWWTKKATQGQVHFHSPTQSKNYVKEQGTGEAKMFKNNGRKTANKSVNLVDSFNEFVKHHKQRHLIKSGHTYQDYLNSFLKHVSKITHNSTFWDEAMALVGNETKGLKKAGKKQFWNSAFKYINCKREGKACKTKYKNINATRKDSLFRRLSDLLINYNRHQDFRQDVSEFSSFDPFTRFSKNFEHSYQMITPPINGMPQVVQDVSIPAEDKMSERTQSRDMLVGKIVPLSTENLLTDEEDRGMPKSFDTYSTFSKDEKGHSLRDKNFEHKDKIDRIFDDEKEPAEREVLVGKIVPLQRNIDSRNDDKTENPLPLDPFALQGSSSTDTSMSEQFAGDEELKGRDLGDSSKVNEHVYYGKGEVDPLHHPEVLNPRSGRQESLFTALKNFKALHQRDMMDNMEGSSLSDMMGMSSSPSFVSDSRISAIRPDLDSPMNSNADALGPSHPGVEDLGPLQQEYAEPSYHVYPGDVTTEHHYIHEPVVHHVSLPPLSPPPSPPPPPPPPPPEAKTNAYAEIGSVCSGPLVQMCHCPEHQVCHCPEHPDNADSHHKKSGIEKREKCYCYNQPGSVIKGNQTVPCIVDSQNNKLSNDEHINTSFESVAGTSTNYEAGGTESAPSEADHYFGQENYIPNSEVIGGYERQSFIDAGYESQNISSKPPYLQSHINRVYPFTNEASPFNEFIPDVPMSNQQNDDTSSLNKAAEVLHSVQNSDFNNTTQNVTDMKDLKEVDQDLINDSRKKGILHISPDHKGIPEMQNEPGQYATPTPTAHAITTETTAAATTTSTTTTTTTTTTTRTPTTASTIATTTPTPATQMNKKNNSSEEPDVKANINELLTNKTLEMSELLRKFADDPREIKYQEEKDSHVGVPKFFSGSDDTRTDDLEKPVILKPKHINASDSIGNKGFATQKYEILNMNNETSSLEKETSTQGDVNKVKLDDLNLNPDDVNEKYPGAQHGISLIHRNESEKLPGIQNILVGTQLLNSTSSLSEEMPGEADPTTNTQTHEKIDKISVPKEDHSDLEKNPESSNTKPIIYSDENQASKPLSHKGVTELLDHFAMLKEKLLKLIQKKEEEKRTSPDKSEQAFKEIGSLDASKVYADTSGSIKPMEVADDIPVSNGKINSQDLVGYRKSITVQHKEMSKQEGTKTTSLSIGEDENENQSAKAGENKIKGNETLNQEEPQSSDSSSAYSQEEIGSATDDEGSGLENGQATQEKSTVSNDKAPNIKSNIELGAAEIHMSENTKGLHGVANELEANIVTSAKNETRATSAEAHRTTALLNQHPDMADTVAKTKEPDNVHVSEGQSILAKQNESMPQKGKWVFVENRLINNAEVDNSNDTDGNYDRNSTMLQEETTLPARNGLIKDAEVNDKNYAEANKTHDRNSSMSMEEIALPVRNGLIKDAETNNNNNTETSKSHDEKNVTVVLSFKEQGVDSNEDAFRDIGVSPVRYANSEGQGGERDTQGEKKSFTATTRITTTDIKNFKNIPETVVGDETNTNTQEHGLKDMLNEIGKLL